MEQKIRYDLSILLNIILALMVGCSTTTQHEKKLSKTERARMLVEIANGALLEGDATGALQSLLLAEQENPNLPELHHSKALAMYSKHDLDSSVRSARKAVELNPNYSEANNTLGKLLIDSGHYQEAMDPLMLAANDRLYRDSYKAWTNLGILKFRQGEYSISENFMDRAIQDAPSQACIAFYYRGNIKLQKMKFSDAIQDYGHATTRLCAKFGNAHLALGLAYEKSRQYELARKTFLEIQKRYPNTKVAERALDQLKFLP